MFLRILLRRISGKVNNLEIAVLLQKLLRHRPLVPPRIVPSLVVFCDLFYFLGFWMKHTIN